MHGNSNIKKKDNWVLIHFSSLRILCVCYITKKNGLLKHQGIKNSKFDWRIGGFGVTQWLRFPQTETYTKLESKFN